MAFAITALYAVALAVLHRGLTYHVVAARARSRVSILHGDDMELATRIRRHGNFTESVPLALILMALVEAAGAAGLWLHIAGLLLVAGRVLHMTGLHHDRPATFGRIAGTLGTTLGMAVSAVLILGSALG